MRSCTVLLVLFLAAGGLAGAGTVTQTDWSGGPGQPGPLGAWTDTFDTAGDLSWRSMPGQIALASQPLVRPVRHPIADGLAGAYGLTTADLDRDGDLDVIGGIQTAKDLVVWFNLGTTPVTWEAQTVDGDFSGISSVRASDLDGDGDLDLVAAGNKVAWWRNEGGQPIQWTRLSIDVFVPVACNLFAADVDGDGDVDVLSGSYAHCYFAWWRNDGGDPLVWTRQVLPGQLCGAHSVETADLDRDGDADLVLAAAEEDTVSVLYNRGGDPVEWEEQVLSDAMPGARYATAADLDDDGHCDVVAADWSGRVVLWRNRGSNPPTWTEQLVDLGRSMGHWVTVADVDGDGRRDLLVVSYGLHQIMWYENQGGNVSTWTRLVVVDEGFTGPLTAVAGDVDGDGDLDVIGSAFELGAFAWWEVSSFEPEGHLESSVLDLGAAPDLASLDWVAAEPPSTTLTLEVRSSDDDADLGEWAEVAAPGALAAPVGRFVQVRAAMSTSDPLHSPILKEVELSTADGPDCDPDDTTLCLNRGRFQVEVEWEDGAGGSGSGRVVSCGSADTGILWFFSPDNWEMMVKVLDGCGVNGHYWVFAAATTNVGYDLRVEDTLTGATSTYTNPIGNAAPALTDTDAFATCP